MLLDLKVDPIPDLQPRYNIAPTQEVAVVRQRDHTREVAMLRWGLVPPWADDLKQAAKMINARCETVDQKPAFRKAFEQRRCLVVADGYYEWEAIGRRKQPYLITQENDGLYCMAGLWERWFGGPTTRLTQPIETCSIITTDASPSTSQVHDRMPVILPRDQWELWLDPATPAQQLKAALVPYSADLGVRKVSSYVNNARHEGEECIAVVRELF